MYAIMVGYSSAIGMQCADNDGRSGEGLNKCTPSIFKTPLDNFLVGTPKTLVQCRNRVEGSEVPSRAGEIEQDNCQIVGGCASWLGWHPMKSMLYMYLVLPPCAVLPPLSMINCDDTLCLSPMIC